MPPVAVVTDTTHYLPEEVVARHELHLVSLYVNWDGRTDRESDLPDYDGFYDHMRSAATLPRESGSSSHLPWGTPRRSSQRAWSDALSPASVATRRSPRYRASSRAH